MHVTRPPAKRSEAQEREDDMTPLRDAASSAHPATLRCVGRSAAIQSVIADVVDVSSANCAVLLEGESGTGKELIARIIHDIGHEGAAFEAVNCGAIPENLIESELFGHVPGAFTGAVRAHRGVFERAKGGTVFLDEVGEMPQAAQVKLLRVLQEGTFMPVGGEDLLRSQVRVIAASNRNLQHEVERGAFRRDLFYRLNVFPIRIPSLRDRVEDLPALIEHFLDGYSRELGRPRPTVDVTALQRLMVYSYPGNVRELQNIVRTLLIEARRSPVISDAHVVAVFSRHRVGDQTAVLEPAAMPATDDTGTWILGELRRCHFNLAMAERLLKSRKRVSLNAGSLRVASRSGLSYYLQGEGLRALIAEGWSVDRAAERLAGPGGDAPLLVPRVRGKLGRFLKSSVATLKGGGATPAKRREALRRALAKLPDCYESDLDSLAREFERGRWK
jgi:DNA-binding NtrC family response regulator